MARPLRVLYPGALYHVTARGNDRQGIFQTRRDRLHLLELLEEALNRYEVLLLAYVLMTNHYHLVVQTEHPNLDRFMHYLNTAYVVWSNKRNRRTGHLFEGPYKAIAMENAGYLLTATGYVHLNPVRTRGWKNKPVAERMEQVAQYPWSSYRSYTQAGRTHKKLVHGDRVWGELGARTEKDGRRLYRKYVLGWLKQEEAERAKPKDKRDESLLNPFSEVKLGCFLGGDEFRDFIQSLLGPDRELAADVVGYKQWRRELPLGDVLRAVADVLGVEVDELKEQGWRHTRRDMAMYLCREVGERGLREIGEQFGIGVAATGHAIARVKQRMKEERRFRTDIADSRAVVVRILET